MADINQNEYLQIVRIKRFSETLAVIANLQFSQFYPHFARDQSAKLLKTHTLTSMRLTFPYSGTAVCWLRIYYAVNFPNEFPNVSANTMA